MNVQHLESLYDEIERVTNVRVKERIPDRVLAEADQIVNVDVSVEDLIERLNTGKIYPAERISTALENFFTPSNLTRLREITLTEIAHLIDRRNRRAEADQYPAVGDRPRHGRALQPQPQRAGAPAQDGPDRRPAQRPLVRRLHPDPRRRPDPDRRGHPATDQQAPRAGPAARRHPHDVSRARTSPAPSWRSPANTRSRSSSSARAGSPGIDASGAARSSTVSNASRKASIS